MVFSFIVRLERHGPSPATPGGSLEFRFDAIVGIQYL